MIPSLLDIKEIHPLDLSLTLSLILFVWYYFQTLYAEVERLAEKAQNIAAGVPSPECMAVWKKKSNYVVPWLDAEGESIVTIVTTGTILQFG